MARPSITYNFTPHWHTSLTAMAFLRNKKAKSDFAPLIETSEMTLKLGYQW
jgi:hypothetical protein